MSKRSLLVTLAVCGAALAAVQPARADGVPGAPPAVGGVANAPVTLFENFGLSEVKNRAVSAPVCDGYVTMAEPAAEGGGTSDIVVFHDTAVLPSGLCAATCVTVLSDPNPEPPGETSSVFPAAGCLFQVTNADGTCGALLPAYAATGVCPPPPAAQCVTGSACLPQNLLGLTVAHVTAGAGVAPNPVSGTKNPTPAALPEIKVLHTNSLGAIYSAGSAGATNKYTVYSDIPALPPWAFMLLGGVLAGSAVVVLRKRTSGMTPAA